MPDFTVLRGYLYSKFTYADGIISIVRPVIRTCRLRRLYLKANRYPKVAALIDIGSSETRMQIAQIRKGKLNRIEALSYPVALGRDVYSTGRVSQATVRELIKALEGFLNVIREYAAEEVAAVTTNALRRAENRGFVLDQVKIRTGLDVMVLEDNEDVQKVQTNCAIDLYE